MGTQLCARRSVHIEVINFVILRSFNAPINVKPTREGGGGGGRAWGGDLTFFKNLQSNSLPMGKSFQSIATKFPHPGLHVAVKYPKAEPKKGTIKISPNKTLQSLFILRCCITKDTFSCYSCNYTLLTIICVTLRRIQKSLGQSPHFGSLNVPFLVKGTKKVNFISLQ